jgi:hypothetical protein
MRKFQGFFMIMFILLTTNDIEAQQWNRKQIESVIDKGTGIRLNSVKVGQLTGFVTAIDDTFLTIFQEDRGPLKVELTSITSLEISGGNSSHTLAGLAIGGACGLLFGLIAPVDPNATQEDMEGGIARSRNNAIIGGLVAGSVLGTLIGSLIRTDDWISIPIDSTIQKINK